MKKIKLYAFALVAFVTLSAFNLSPVKAQDKSDTAQIVTPVFNGSEKNLVDSLASINAAINDPQTKATIDNAIATVSNVPAKGSSPSAYVAYVLAVLGMLFGVYHWVQRKLAKPDVDASKTS